MFTSPDSFFRNRLRQGARLFVCLYDPGCYHSLYLIHDIQSMAWSKCFVRYPIKQAYGNPIAMVHDMGSAILNAIKAVFPKPPYFICHFHFLKDIGKDLFGQEYGTIRRYLTSHAIRTRLRQSAKGLKQAIDAGSEHLALLEQYLTSKSLHQPLMSLPPVVTAYLMITWVLEAKQDSHGFGFPFDRPHVDFYCRRQEAYPDLQRES